MQNIADYLNTLQATLLTPDTDLKPWGHPHFQAMPKPTQPKHVCASSQTNPAKGRQLRYIQDLP